MSREVKIGMTDYSVFIFIPDSAQTDGSGKTGLVAANLTVSGSRMETDNDATVTDYTSSLNDLAALTTAHTDWGLKEVSSTLAPGLYRLDIADAIFASGAWSAVVYVMVTTSAAAPTPIEFILIPQSPIDGVLLAPTTHTSAVIPTVTTTGTATAVTTVNGLGAGVITAASIAADAITDAKVASDVTIASVTGAVGSVTGAVGSVTGAVGSVTAGVTLANGAHGGAAATLQLKTIAVAADSNNTAVTITGSGSGEGLKITGGATGNALELIGGGTSGHGISLSTSDGYGILISAGAGGTFASADAIAMTLNGGTGSIVGNLAGDIEGSVNSVTALATGSVNAAALATDAVNEIADGILDRSASSHTTNSTLGAIINDLEDGGRTDLLIDAILDDTGTAGVVVASASKSGYALSSTGMDAVTLPANIITASSINAGAIGASELGSDVITDIWQGTALTESYAANGATATPAQLLYMIYASVVQFVISSTSINMKGIDGTTTAMVATVDSSTAPTQRIRSA